MLDARFWIKQKNCSSIQHPEASPALAGYLFVLGTMFDTKTLAQTDIMRQPFQDFGLDKRQCPCK
jgi:hypothetical protein